MCSTFCTALLGEINRRIPGQVAFAPMDGFHYTRAQLDEFPDPKDAHYRRGAVDTFDADAWFSLVRRLRNLKRDETISVPGFDHAVKDPEEGKISIQGDKRIVLLEGNYLLVSLRCHATSPNISNMNKIYSCGRNLGLMLLTFWTSGY